MALNKSLGRIKRVKLNEVWADEARDFTPWLAEKDNLNLLAETLGIDIELEGVEVSVGPFSADIQCRKAGEEGWVVIENQIRRTDHTHLGQILTYAAGLGATTLVWIAEDFRDEHRAALDWLNSHTTDDVSVFGVEIEVWQIGNSELAPKFNLVSKPNDWSKSVKKSAVIIEPGASETLRTRLEFWTSFQAWLAEHTNLEARKVTSDPWLRFSIGSTHARIEAVASSWSYVTGFEAPELRVDLILDSNQAKRWFEYLEVSKDELTKKFGAALGWRSLPEGRRARVFVHTSEDFTKKERWNEQFEWLARNIQAMRDVFAPILQRGLPSEQG